MILWFSGTGNSRSVAEQLALQLNDRNLRQLTPDLRGSNLPVPADETRIIWVYPVYSWGIPPFVRSIIRSSNLGTPGAVHHLVLTCGDDCGLAADMWRKDLSRRDRVTGLAFSVTMPNNYVCMSGFNVDQKDLAEKKLDDCAPRIVGIARAISAYTADGDGQNESVSSRHRNDDIVRGRFAWIKTRVIYPWFVRYAMSPAPFHSTARCISCGKCAAICPLRNISMVQQNRPDATPHRRKRPEWGTDCAFCLACYHVCPKHAVMYGKNTDDKGQYLNPILKR